jgi:uncharacterized protein YcfJ
MKKTVLFSAVFAALAGASALASAQEMGRVISSTPMIQQVAVPHQVCTTEPVVTSAPKTGAGAAMGAVAGGALGNAVGQGGGRAAATVLGLIGGAILGDRVEGGGTQVQNVQQCSTQTSYENRTVGYSVVYEYAGKQYSVQMPQDPGPYVRLQVTPVGSAMPPPPVQAPVSSVVQPAVVVPATTVVYPQAYYAPAPYYSPVGVSLNLGYYRGYGHWR